MDLAGFGTYGNAVHWHLEGSSLGWEPLPPITQIVYTLAGAETTDRKVNENAPVELYAGTSDGLYTWNRLDNWEKVGETTQITLLGIAPSGLYAGDSTRVRHRIESTDGWKPIATNKKGVTDTYKDEPIVQQGRAYLTERIPTIAQTGGEVDKWVSGFVRSLAFGFGGFLATLLLALSSLSMRISRSTTIFVSLSRCYLNPIVILSSVICAKSIKISNDS